MGEGVEIESRHMPVAPGSTHSSPFCFYASPSCPETLRSSLFPPHSSATGCTVGPPFALAAPSHACWHLSQLHLLPLKWQFCWQKA